MSAHTPGPWFADKHGAIWRRDPKELYENGGGTAGDRPIATAHIGWSEENTTGYNVKANARLIAAAPDLLKALQLSISAFEGDAIDEIEAEYGVGTAQRVHAARTAITKATGGAA